MTFMPFFKFLYFLLMVSIYFVVSLPILPFSYLFPYGSRKYQSRILSIMSRLTLVGLGVKVNTSQYFVKPSKRPYLIVSNHLSYLDILVYSSLFPACYVTSMEMKRILFLGQLTQLAGCLYVDRLSRENLGKEVEDLTNALNNGLNVVVFPEATSTNGEQVKRFRSPLFQASLDSLTDVYPLCINYTLIDGDKVCVNNRDDIFWYGDMGFFSHFIRFLSHRKIEVEVSSLPLLPTKSYKTSKNLAAISELLVQEEYRPIIS